MVRMPVARTRPRGAAEPLLKVFGMDHVCLLNLPEIDEPDRLARLSYPQGRIDLVIDTDASNEIDDQLALVHGLLSPERLNLQAVYAAPYVNQRADTPAEGMERSRAEIHRIFEKMGQRAEGRVFRGATEILSDYYEPAESEAAEDLIRRAAARTGAPLYVVCIAGITNVASAILMAPEIIKRIVLVWLAGHARYWPAAVEFNLGQDLMASRLIFDCGVPLINIPCNGVASHLIMTPSEMTQYVQGRGAIGDYLAEIFRGYHADQYGWSKVIWDMAAVAYLLDDTWVRTHLVHSPVVTDGWTRGSDPTRHLIRSAWSVDRNAIFRDFFLKLAAAADSANG